MPALDLSAEDQLMLVELRRTYRDEIDTALAPLRQQVNGLAQRTSRPPGSAALEHAALEISVGRKFADSSELKALLSAPGQRGRAICNVGGLFAPREQKQITNVTTVPPTVRLPGIVAQPRRALRLRDLIPVRPYDAVSAQAVDYLRQSPRTTTAAPQINQGDLKAEVQIATSLVTAKFSTIACWCNSSRQVLMDIDLLQAFINQELLYQTQLEEEKEIIGGTGAAAGQLDGLLPAATPFNPALSLTGDTNLDILARAETQLLSADVEPTAFILNPLDMSYIETLKTTFGSYLANEPGDGDFGDDTLWGLKVVRSNSMPVGQFLVGDFLNGCMLLDRMAATVELSTENSDNFVRNLVTIRAEERVALLTFAPWAFVKGAFAAGTQATRGDLNLKPQK